MQFKTFNNCEICKYLSSILLIGVEWERLCFLIVFCDTAMSHFAEVPLAEPDAIFNLTTSYNNDTFSKKLNLGVGAYRTAEAQPYVLNVVKKVIFCNIIPFTISLNNSK